MITLAGPQKIGRLGYHKSLSAHDSQSKAHFLQVGTPFCSHSHLTFYQLIGLYPQNSFPTMQPSLPLIE